MQMLFVGSEESAETPGLGVIPGTVRWIPVGPTIPPMKIPQMQWNRLHVTRRDDPMLDGADDAWFYFVHSLHGVPDDPAVVAATVEYGTTLNAAFRLDDVFAVQFHPEKSSAAGLRLLANFVEVCGGPSAEEGSAR
jgi:glutamine amidotransferase